MIDPARNYGRQACIRFKFAARVFVAYALLLDPTGALRAEPFFREISSHTNLVRWLGYSPDGRILASASWDGTICWTDASNVRVLRTLRTKGHQNFWGAFSADSGTFVSGANNSNIWIWDVKTASLRNKWGGSHSNSWTGGMTPDGNAVYGGGSEGNIVRWKTADGTQDVLAKVGAPVWWLAVSPMGNELAVGCGDGQIRIYNTQNTEQKRVFGGRQGGVYCVAYSPDGSRIATAGANGTAKIWSATDGNLIHDLPHFGAVHTVGFSADGKWLAVGGESAILKIYDVATGVFARSLAGHSEPIWTATFAPDGKHLASGGADKKVLVWNWTEPPGGLTTEKTLPKRVDLRPRTRFFGMKIVQQHSRGTCSVHTFTRALEFAISKEASKGVTLSDEYLNWACNQVIGNTGAEAHDRGQFFEHLWIAFRRFGICPAAQMPFRERFDPQYEPSVKARESAKRFRTQTIYWQEISGPGVKNEDTVLQAKKILASGWPLLAGSAHSVLIVGYVDNESDPGGGRFLIADSGGGGFVADVTGDRLHSAIIYNRVHDYGLSWIQCTTGASE